ncbi:6-phosphofructokinase [Verrucomicrobiota bacterium]
MASTLSGNMLIAQSGGPTMVINQTLVGAILEARKHREINKIYGSLNGIKGVLEEKMINLGKESKSTLDAVAATPSSALGTVRKKPSLDECAQIFGIMLKYNIRYFFYIGGNDSAETTHIINEDARKVNYEFRCIHVPKTIDNDLLENDHTPGFGSAAKFVASAVMGNDLDNRAMPGVKIDVIMGRHAGFLTASSALARVYPDDGPHLIYVPERPFSMKQYVSDVKLMYKKHGRCMVAVSEGISDSHGMAIAAKFTRETDSHGNVQLSGSGALGDLLVNEIKSQTHITRVRADTFGYLQRSFPMCISQVDAQEARAVGEIAVRTAVSDNIDGSIVIRRKPGKKYKVGFECVSLDKVAKGTRHMPSKFINKHGNDITPAFIEYVRPIVGPLPQIGRLKAAPVPAIR